jgi:hypothetical protein
MTTQSTALKMADSLDKFSNPWDKEVAAELRRLHAIEGEWAQLSQDDGKAERQIARLHAVNQELLEALKLAVRQNDHDMLMTGEELRVAYAAIVRAAAEIGRNMK